jgi:hypothetical protein
MRATLQNAAQTASLGLFFTIVLTGLSANIPASIGSSIAALNIGPALSSQVSGIISGTSPTILLFSAFLGQNPVVPILQATGVYMHLPLSAQLTIAGKEWFPDALAGAFMSSLRIAFILGIIMSLIAAFVSSMRGKKYVHEGAKSIFNDNDETKNSNQLQQKATEPKEMLKSESGK